MPYPFGIHATAPTPTPSPGSDPTKLIEDLAKRKKIKCLGVSMGQGQEVAARKYMAAAAAEGHWVLLQNTHLGLGYLHEVGGPGWDELMACGHASWLPCRT